MCDGWDFTTCPRSNLICCIAKEGVEAEVLQRTAPGPQGCWLGQGQLEYTLNLPTIALKLPKIALSRLKSLKIAIMLWRILLKSPKIA